MFSHIDFDCNTNHFDFNHFVVLKYVLQLAFKLSGNDLKSVKFVSITTL